MDSLVQASAGGAAACFTTLILYPMDVVKTRLNRGSDEHGKSYNGLLDVILRQGMERGLPGFYSGIQVKLVQDLLRSFTFFYMFSALKQAYKKHLGEIGVWPNLFLGYSAASMNLLITMPVEVANTRIITGVSKGGLFSTWREIIRHKGLTGLYTGVLANVVLCANPAIKHMMFDQIRKRLLQGRQRLSAAQAFWLGALATAVASTATYPAARTRAILQSNKHEDKGGESASTNGEKENEFTMVKKIVEGNGLMGLYQGLLPHLAKGIVSSAILLAAKESIHQSTTAVLTFIVLFIRRALFNLAVKRGKLKLL